MHHVHQVRINRPAKQAAQFVVVSSIITLFEMGCRFCIYFVEIVRNS